MLMGSLEIQWDKVLNIVGIQEMLNERYLCKNTRVSTDTLVYFEKKRKENKTKH